MITKILNPTLKKQKNLIKDIMGKRHLEAPRPLVTPGTTSISLKMLFIMID
jgi:hypothetical protein